MRYRSTPAAALRPSAMAQTMSDWPRCMSPAANTPGTLVIHSSSVQTAPRSVVSRLGEMRFYKRFLDEVDAIEDEAAG